MSQIPQDTSTPPIPLPADLRMGDTLVCNLGERLVFKFYDMGDVRASPAKDGSEIWTKNGRNWTDPRTRWIVRIERAKASPTVKPKGLEWVYCKDRMPTTKDADHKGDVEWMRSGEPTLVRVAKGKPVDADYWRPLKAKRPLIIMRKAKAPKLDPNKLRVSYVSMEAAHAAAEVPTVSVDIDYKGMHLTITKTPQGQLSIMECHGQRLNIHPVANNHIHITTG